MSSRSDQAVERFTRGWNCAQAAFTVFAGDLGFDEKTAARLAAGFGGGLGREGEACGAVTGAIMALSLRHAGSQPEVAAERQKAYDMAQAVVREFRARFGSAVCRDLIGCALNTPEGLRKAREQKRFQNVCPRYLRAAVELAEKLMEA
jgi:C_GCAxxG_C_C family probable redox protein